VGATPLYGVKSPAASPARESFRSSLGEGGLKRWRVGELNRPFTAFEDRGTAIAFSFNGGVPGLTVAAASYFHQPSLAKAFRPKRIAPRLWPLENIQPETTGSKK
jgi:hypothetical protein